MNPLLWALWAGVEWVLSHFHHGLVVMNDYDWRLAQRLPLVRPANMLFLAEGVGVNLARWHDLPPDVRARKRAELEVPDGAPVVLMAARTDARKGAFEYVRAAARLLQSGEAADAVFLLAGTGPCDERLRALVRELGVSDHVRLLGWRADMAELVGLCDLFVLPSYYPEGRPTTLAEAQAAGKPVVTTRYRGCQDAVVEGETALLVPPRDVPALADAMARVLRDADLGRSLGEAGRRHAHAHFDAERLAAQFADIVEAVARYRGRAVGHR
jgi:glycosyltransferase involved in cell wall biosynthesis